MATKTEQLLAYLQTPGLSDAAIANEINRIGISAQEVSDLTGVPVATVQQRITAATPVTPVTPVTQVTTPVTQVTTPVTTPTATRPTFNTQAETSLYNYLQTPGLSDAQIAAEINRLGLNSQQVSSMTGVPVAQVQSRFNYNTFQNWLKTTPNLTDTQIAAEMNRLGITTGQVGQITGMPGTDIENRFRATTPFAGATQGFAQNFNNYTSIPIGAQYNPNVVGGTGSPYSQIMGQMRPMGNAYENVVGNLPMGGYDPGLYDRLAKANAAAKIAADTAGTTGDNSTAGGAANGGYVHGGLMFGPNPPGPDDGAVNLDLGEYVIKKSSVDKYGRGLLDMINEGKVPAKKMKSLLG